MRRRTLTAGLTVMAILTTQALSARVITLIDRYPGTAGRFSQDLTEALRQANLPVVTADGQVLSALLDAETGPGGVLILPDSRYFPVSAVQSLRGYLKRGNHLLAMSGYAFDHLVVFHNGEWLTREQARKRLAAQTGARLLSFTARSAAEWSRVSGAPASQTTWSVQTVEDPRIGHALHWQTDRLDNWDLIAGPQLPSPLPEGTAGFAFWARGSDGSPPLNVQWQETDGTRWVARVPLTPEWKRHALSVADFTLWPDGAAPGRGQAGDHLRLDQLSRLSLIMGLTPENPEPGKPYGYAISDIDAIPDPFAGTVWDAPLLESLSPPYKCYQTVASEAEMDGMRIPLPVDLPVTCAFGRGRGLGSECIHPSRFIPLVEVSSRGVWRGVAAHLMLNTTTEYKGSVWGFLGVDQSALELGGEQLLPFIVSAVERLRTGVFFTNAGAEHAAYAVGETVQSAAWVSNLSEAPVRVRAALRVLQAGRVVHTGTATAEVPARTVDSPVRMDLGAAKLAAGEYRAHVDLYLNDRRVDTIVHPVQVISYRPVQPRDQVTVQDGNFMLDGRPWYPLGVNYYPRSAPGLETSDMYERTWLSPEQYDPDIVERDLAQMRQLKMNAVSIQYTRMFQARPLMDFMARAHRHGLKIYLYVEGLHPLEQNHWGVPNNTPFDQWAGQMLLAAHIPQSPAMFAYDMGWEVTVGRYPQRRRFDAAWQQWVVDRYGGIEQAIADWGYMPERADGVLTGPSDEQLKQDGDWRVFVAAYRRFMDDYISRGYRRMRANIRSIDTHNLMGARSGYGGTGAQFVVEWMPFDLWSGAKHLDFTAPEAYALKGDWAEFRMGGLNNAYGRFCSQNKPVFWPEFGVPVFLGVQPQAYRHGRTAEDLDRQAAFGRMMIRMLETTGGNGAVGWWWPGGFRLIEHSDFGFIAPDGTPRPVALLMRDAAERFYQPRPAPTPDVWLTADRDAHVTGYAGVYDELTGPYTRAIAEGKTPGVRSAGTGTTSADTPLTAVGNRPFNGHNPPRYLNAEFNSLKINGRVVQPGDTVTIDAGTPLSVEASVGNTAEASWLARANGDGAVRLAIDSPIGRHTLPIVRDTPFLGDATIRRTRVPMRITEATELAFRMTALGRADFGEVIRITVLPSRQ